MMSGEKEISIIMVTLNAEEHVAEAVRSVVLQDGVAVELIVVDGRSTDRTLDIVRRTVESSRISLRAVTQVGKGIYSAMNQGIARAVAPIIGILNADDWLLPGALGAVHAAFRRTPAGVVAGQGLGMRSIGGRDLYFPLSSSWPSSAAMMSVMHPATFVRKNIYAEHGAFDETFALSADYDFFLRLASRGVEALILDQRLAVFRLGGATTARKCRALWEDRLVRRRWYPRRIADGQFIRQLTGHIRSVLREACLRCLLGGARFDRIRAQRIARRFPEINPPGDAPLRPKRTDAAL
jgi:glycosyltransferase involved in cell wall biosynthesis